MTETQEMSTQTTGWPDCYSKGDIEAAKLFDDLMELRAIKKHIGSNHKAEVMEIDGHKLDPEKAVDCLLAMKIRDLKKLTDLTDPLDADSLLREFEQLPGVAVAIKFHDQREAKRRAAGKE